MPPIGPNIAWVIQEGPGSFATRSSRPAPRALALSISTALAMIVVDTLLDDLRPSVVRDWIKVRRRAPAEGADEGAKP